MNHSLRTIIFTLKKIILLLFWLQSCSPIGGFAPAFATQIQKTHIITAESTTPIVLDCDYNADDYNSTLVVKWLKDEKPIYQWIKGRKPTVYPLSKGSIDEEYESSTYSNYKHRAIAFPVPTKNLTGNYKCLVETMNSTQLIQTHLQVIDVSQSELELDSITLTNDTHVSCAVENVYPKPKLVVWANDDVQLSTISENVSPQEDGYFYANIVVSASDIDADDEIGCTLQFPGFEYNVTKILKSSTSKKKVTLLGLSVMFMLVMFA